MTEYKPIHLPPLPPLPGSEKRLDSSTLNALAIGAIGLMAVIVYLISVYLPGDKGRLANAHNQIEKLLQENAALKSELEDERNRTHNQTQAIETLQAETQTQQERLNQIFRLSKPSKGEN